MGREVAADVGDATPVGLGIILADARMTSSSID